MKSRPTAYAYTLEKPSDYLIWSIITTAMFGFVFGFIALFYSMKTHEYNQTGDMIKASTNSKVAYLFNMVGTVFGIIAYIIVLTLVFVYIGRY